jgi:undecaprenyl-diphosphatase
VDIDEQLLRVALTRGHSPVLDRLVARFTLLGEHSAVWLAIGAVCALADPPRRARWGRATGTVAGTYALNTAVKLVVRRSRPRLRGLRPLVATPTTLSFPSAHASTAFAGAFAYSRLGLPALPLYALAAGLAGSRLYLGVHYPSDVLAGALLGTGVAIARGGGGAQASPSLNGSGPIASSSNGHGRLRPARSAGGAQ